MQENIVHVHTYDRAAGYLEYERARVRCFLSINHDTLTKEVKENASRTYRSITIDGEEMEFSGGFTDLHTTSYEAILNGMEFGLEEARHSIETVHDIRSQNVVGLKGEYHPLTKMPMKKHPFYVEALGNFDS